MGSVFKAAKLKQPSSSFVVVIYLYLSFRANKFVRQFRSISLLYQVYLRAFFGLFWPWVFFFAFFRHLSLSHQTIVRKSLNGITLPFQNRLTLIFKANSEFSLFWETILLKLSQNKKGRKNFQLHRFLNNFSQLPAVKQYSKDGAAGKFFGPSYFDLPLYGHRQKMPGSNKIMIYLDCLLR